MYAVFRSGGKQYRASEGERVRVERLDAQEGDTVEFEQILMIGDGADVTLGAPLVQDSFVKGVVTSQGRGKKVVVTKFKRRKNYKRIMGHRQHYTEVQITSIGAEAPEVKAKAKSRQGDGCENQQGEGPESCQDNGCENHQGEGVESHQGDGCENHQGKSSESRQDNGCENQQGEGPESRQGKSSENGQGERCGRGRVQLNGQESGYGTQKGRRQLQERPRL